MHIEKDRVLHSSHSWSAYLLRDSNLSTSSLTSSSSSSYPRTFRVPVCDIELHCHRDHILNQYTTVIQPDDAMDRSSLEKTVFHDRTRSSASDGENNAGSSSSNQVTGGSTNLQLMLNAFKNWEDPWPSDYDNESAPPVGTSLETLWNVSS